MAQKTSLVAHLSRSAQTYSKRAVEAYVKGEFGDFALFAGIAIEHAAKAKLAQANAAFLAPDKRFQDAIALHSASSDIARLPAGVSTIGAAGALERLGKLEPTIRQQLNAAQDVMNIRNGEAHLGFGVPRGRRREARTRRTELFVLFLKTINELLLVESDKYWDLHADYVRTVLDDHSAEVEKGVAARMSEARIRFGRLVGDLSNLQVDALTVAVRMDRDRKVDHLEVFPHDCPVCKSPALLIGTTEDTDWDVEMEDGVVMYAHPELSFFVDFFQCEGCGLELDYEEELAAAGLETEFKNTTVDVNTWLEAEQALAAHEP